MNSTKAFQFVHHTSQIEPPFTLCNKNVFQRELTSFTNQRLAKKRRIEGSVIICLNLVEVTLSAAKTMTKNHRVNSLQ